jgi:hypothetical protein
LDIDRHNRFCIAHLTGTSKLLATRNLAAVGAMLGRLWNGAPTPIAAFRGFSRFAQ